jgi:hypothetical protein
MLNWTLEQVYTIFLGENMYSIYPGITKLAWMMIAVPLLILLCWIRHLKWLAPFSLLAITIFLFGFTVALYFSVAQPAFSKLGTGGYEMSPMMCLRLELPLIRRSTVAFVALWICISHIVSYLWI